MANGIKGAIKGLLGMPNPLDMLVPYKGKETLLESTQLNQDKVDKMVDNAHGAIDSKISQNNLNPNNIKNKVQSETLDFYDIFPDPVYNRGEAIFTGQTEGGDTRFYKRPFDMPSTYYTTMDEPYSDKDQIMQVLKNAIRRSPDDTVSTQSVQDLYKLHKQPMPKYKKGGKVKKDDDINLGKLINMLANSKVNVYSERGKEIDSFRRAINQLWDERNLRLETGSSGEVYPNLGEGEYGLYKTPGERERDLELESKYRAGAVSKDIPLETGSSDAYSIFNPRHPDFVGF